jgi:hypothetical protein
VGWLVFREVGSSGGAFGASQLIGKRQNKRQGGNGSELGSPFSGLFEGIMHVKSMVIDGFKSYGRRVEIKQFDPSFNAITGLNGTGKIRSYFPRAFDERVSGQANRTSWTRCAS